MILDKCRMNMFPPKFLASQERERAIMTLDKAGYVSSKIFSKPRERERDFLKWMASVVFTVRLKE